MSERFVYEGEDIGPEMAAANSFARLFGGLGDVGRLIVDQEEENSLDRRIVRESYDVLCDDLADAAERFVEDYDIARNVAGQDGVRRLDTYHKEAVETVQLLYGGLHALYEESVWNESAMTAAVEDRCGISFSGPQDYDYMA